MSQTEEKPTFWRITVTPDQRFIIGGYAIHYDVGHILTWDFKTGAFVKSYEWRHDILSDLVVTPDNRFIVASGGDLEGWGSDHDLIVDAINIETGAYQRIKSRVYGSHRLLLSWDRKYLRVDDFSWDWRVGGDAKLMLKSEQWLAATRDKIELSGDRFLYYFNRYTDHDTFVIGKIDRLGRSNIILQFDLGLNKKFPHPYPHTLTPDRRFFLIQMCDFDAPNWRPKNAVLSMWDMQTGRLVKSFEACKGWLLDIDVTPDSRFAAVTLFNTREIIQVIDLETGEKVLEFYPEPLKKGNNETIGPQ